MPQPSSTPIGEYVRAQLAARRMSARELARRAGMSPNTVSVLLRGLAEPRKGTLERLAAALGVPFEDLRAAMDATLAPASAPDAIAIASDRARAPYLAALARLPAGALRLLARMARAFDEMTEEDRALLDRIGRREDA